MQKNDRRAIGRGLGALIQEARPNAAGGGVTKLPVDQIRPDGHQPRRGFDEAALLELATSIQNQGLLQPVLVRKDARGYRLIAGERRWRAAQKAGLRDIPAIVKEVTEAEAFELALVENLQRSDLSPLEEAEGYRRLLDERKWTQEQVADRVGKERSSVANALRLLQLPAEVKAMLGKGELDMGHARALLGAPSAQEMLVMARAVIAEKLSVRETEARVRAGRSPGGATQKKAAKQSPEARRLIEDLQRRLGTKVHLKERGGGKGSLEVEFYSYEDLDRIASLIRR